MFLFILTMAAAEVAVGLALVAPTLPPHWHALDADAAVDADEADDAATCSGSFPRVPFAGVRRARRCRAHGCRAPAVAIVGAGSIGALRGDHFR